MRGLCRPGAVRAYALAAAEPYGVWGGLSESARDAILGRPARAS
ncbi:MAG TPA: WhiB family transcriptional regulator [Nakamurella sp.]|nr:WhiB family transcriptional regulator [Nakamurella sp.]